MKILVESLKRMYTDKKISEEKIQSMAILTDQEKIYILGK